MTMTEAQTEPAKNPPTSYTLIDGLKAAAEIKQEIAARVDALRQEGKKTPHLAIIMVGENGASKVYVNGKIRACREVGFNYSLLRFSENIPEDRLLRHVDHVNEDQDVDGFIVQLPLPEHIDVEKITERILPEKDVDGFTNQNFGSIMSRHPLLMPATPHGVMELLRRNQIKTEGKCCVLVGASRLVGAPLGIMLVEQGKATVTFCHRYTRDLSSYTCEADVLITAVGKPNLIKANMVKKGAVVIDIGSTRVRDESKKDGYALKGDVDFDEVAPLCSYITPVPGGVGPMTVASLLLNTLRAAEQRGSSH